MIGSSRNRSISLRREARWRGTQVVDSTTTAPHRAADTRSSGGCREHGRAYTLFDRGAGDVCAPMLAGLPKPLQGCRPAITRTATHGAEGILD
jgi:hypothetical protein